MRLLSMAGRNELVSAISERYRGSLRSEKARILDEFAAVTGYHRKHAMRLLREGRPDKRSGPRLARRVYDEGVREALVVLWEASDRVCGKRLKPLSMPIHTLSSSEADRSLPLWANSLRYAAKMRRGFRHEEIAVTGEPRSATGGAFLP